jgi:hypothetical protein
VGFTLAIAPGILGKCQFLDFIAGGMLFFLRYHGTEKRRVATAEEGNIQNKR